MTGYYTVEDIKAYIAEKTGKTYSNSFIYHLVRGSPRKKITANNERKTLIYIDLENLPIDIINETPETIEKDNDNWVRIDLLPRYGITLKYALYKTYRKDWRSFNVKTVKDGRISNVKYVLKTDISHKRIKKDKTGRKSKYDEP